METLLYAEEHRSCLNYRIPHVAAIKVEQFPGDSAYHIIDTHEATLFFMLEGEAYITSNNYKNILHRNGYMSLQPANSIAAAANAIIILFIVPNTLFVTNPCRNHIRA